jgi:Glycosyl hydrolases family 2, sugar binding domain
VVPFAPESKRSGVERTDFLEAVWYRRTITLPPIWAGKRVLLHFQAVDHDATVWVNGVEVARHRGGFTPFTADLAGVAGPGDQATIVVRARDTRHGAQARGKQATWFANSGPYYTRTTGIWQSVWVELVGAVAGIRCAGVRTATHSPRGGIPRVRGWMACASPPSEEASATETPERSHEL